MKIFRRWLQKPVQQNPGAVAPVPLPPAMPAPVPSARPVPLRSAGLGSAPAFDRTPDKPEPFGYKVSWFAVRTADPALVLDALELGAGTPANWASGLAAVYARGEDRWVFISPPLNGWVMAISTDWPYPTIETQQEIGRKFDLLFSRLMKRFDDVQFFGRHRVSDFATWARAVNGEPKRLFGWIGSNGEVFMNFGDQTPEEAKLGLVDLTGLSLQDSTDAIFKAAEEDGEKQDAGEESARRAFPDEDVVVELAGLWSIDPSMLHEQDIPPGVGLAARLPNALRQ